MILMGYEVYESKLRWFALYLCHGYTCDLIICDVHGFPCMMICGCKGERKIVRMDLKIKVDYKDYFYIWKNKKCTYKEDFLLKAF